MFHHITELIGNTPLLKANALMQQENLYATLLLKLESFNPLSSAKDRAALFMLQDAKKRGVLCDGGTVIEPTSGNTGVGLAYLCTVMGYRLILTMPDSMSLERRNLLKALGAEVVLTPGDAGMQGAVEKANELNRDIPNSVILDQFGNYANAEAHYCTTGPEIWNDTQGNIDCFVATVGTGGTLTGCARALKERKKEIHILAVEPAESPVLSGKEAHSHGIQGIGANFVPAVLERELIDEIALISTQEAYAMTKRLLKSEGVFAGISSGAAVAAALKWCAKKENAGKVAVAILPDSGERYLSTGVFDS